MGLTRRRFIQRAGAAGVAAAARWLSPPPSASAADDPVAYSFVVMGCNRINEGDIRPDNPSTANLPQIERSFAEIARLEPAPSLLFFTGDLVFGLDRDVLVLERQLRAWIELYRASPVGRTSGIRLVALPGNHESLRLAPGYQEVSNQGAEAMWLSVMSPYIAGDNGPKAGGSDRLQTDQSRLTYSFRFRDTHFVVMNTDPYGAVATVPWTWVASDVARARRDRSVKNIFCLGHKPAFTPADATPDFSLDTHPRQRDRLWNAMNGARVTALITAHAHLWDRERYASTNRPTVRGTWQIIAGNGGSQLDGRWIRRADNGYFGFAVVRVTASGRAFVESHGRDYPSGQYLAPSPAEQFPTTIRDAGEITFALSQTSAIAG